MVGIQQVQASLRFARSPKVAEPDNPGGMAHLVVRPIPGTGTSAAGALIKQERPSLWAKCSTTMTTLTGVVGASPLGHDRVSGPEGQGFDPGPGADWKTAGL